MATVTTKSKAGSKAQNRTARFHKVNDRFGTLDMTIVKGNTVEEFGYYVEELAQELGNGFRCFRLTKPRAELKPGEPATYDVALDTQPVDPKEPQHSCECLGFLRWSRCKHVSSLLALIQAGRI